MAKLQEPDPLLIEVAQKFDIDNQIKEIELLNGGLINTTYKVVTSDGKAYVLQNKNTDIFKDVPAMMDNILKVTSHLKEKVSEEEGDPSKEAMTVILSKEGLPYYKTKEGEFWTMSLFIPDTVQFDNPVTLSTAYKGGQGIGKFHLQMADFEKDLAPTIPGFHDLGFRFSQWDEILKKDPVNRVAEVKKEIKWVEKRRPQMSFFWKLVEKGSLPRRVVHNDTKISNFLFDKNEDLLCVIDLDTVMLNTPLADFGDAIRSFANKGREDDTELENVSLDLEIFRAYTEGYLSKVKKALTKLEKDYLAFGALYITYEQVIRFLMDYIDGDNYYRTEYPQHNLVRTRAQMKLLESMEENYDTMNKIVNSFL